MLRFSIELNFLFIVALPTNAVGVIRNQSVFAWISIRNIARMSPLLLTYSKSAFRRTKSTSSNRGLSADWIWSRTSAIFISWPNVSVHQIRSTQRTFTKFYNFTPAS